MGQYPKLPAIATREVHDKNVDRRDVSRWILALGMAITIFSCASLPIASLLFAQVAIF